MLLRTLFLALITTLVSACKVAVIVVEGGEVQSVQSGTCLSGSVCLHEINAADFNETFTAVADQDWIFDGWVSGDGFLCSHLAVASCNLSNVGLAGNPTAEAVIASDTVFYVMPRFKRAAPIVDTVTVDGTTWAQVDLFLDIPWSDLNAACPGGPCTNGAVLAGYDMTGWTWATLGEVGALFQATTPHPGGIAEYSEFILGNFQWADDFMDIVGFRKTFDLLSLQARVVTGYASGPGIEPKAHIQRFVFPENYAAATTTGGDTATALQERNGAWFFQTP